MKSLLFLAFLVPAFVGVIGCKSSQWQAVHLEQPAAHYYMEDK